MDMTDQSRPPREATDVTTPTTREEGGVEVVGGREAIEPAQGFPTESKMFGAIGAFYLAAGVIYWFLSYEAAGTALLVGSGAFAFTAAVYFAWKLRGVQQEVEDVDAATPAPEHVGLYLPHTSVWPLGAGVGAALTLAGIAIGWWVLIPGVALLVHSLIGFAAQSRDRS
jgi:hypothetical protein